MDFQYLARMIFAKTKYEASEEEITKLAINMSLLDQK